MSEKILGPRRNKARKRRALLLVSLAVAVFTVFFVAGASGTLSGSTFSSANGKLVPTSPDTHDWNNPVETITCGSVIPSSGTNCGLDLVSSQSDDALGQGSKEDQTSVQVVDGSIPPSKDDLSRFYVNHDKVGSNDYLYLAWERSNLLGSAHLDFELNKNAVGLTSTTPAGTIILNRTAGDKLIDFDFGGSGVPVLAVHTWLVTGTNATADCEIANVYPCWSKGTVLGSSAAEAAVNNAPVTDTNPPGAPRTLDGNSKNGVNSTFGEMGINLQAAGIFSSTGCTSFADAWVKSRSSGNSFGSELKDIIAPIPTTISNCGTIVIKKVTVPSPDTTGTSFSFTPGGTIGTTGFNLKNGESQTYTGVASTGSSSVTETVPAGWDLTSATCDNGDPVTAITVTIGGTTTCTFTNTQRGTIVIKKVTDPNPDASTTSFSFTSAGQIGTAGLSLANGGSKTYSNIKSTTAGGTSSSVGETVPTGWDLKSATCDNNDPVTAITVAPGGTTTCTFTNTQRGTIVIKKVTVPSPDPTSTTFSFTSAGQIGTAGLSLANGGSKTYSNIKSASVGGTSSSVTETVPTGWELTSKTCDNGDLVTAITVAPGGTTTCTFTNTLKFGALKITKQSIKSGNAKLAGAEFSITGPGGYSKTAQVSDANGVVCVDGLLAGDYTVTETKAPTGYTIDNTNGVVRTVTPSGAKCSDASFTGETLTFNDTPKTDLDIKVASQDTGSGGSSSIITCTNDVGGAGIGNSPQNGNSAEVTATGLAPGNYTCKVNIDP
jgi:hypothetical protein